MRIWQCLAVKEMLRYGESPVTIANSVGLPTSVVLKTVINSRILFFYSMKKTLIVVQYVVAK